jgi:recombination-promoting nuclease RpnB
VAITIHQSHDSLFKYFLADIKIAKSFFSVYLHEDIKALCDFSTLKLEPGSFVEKNLRQYFSDILYSVKMLGEKGYLYPLIEHETKPNRMTPFKIQGYIHSIMRQHLSQGHADLPIVVAILYYRGKVTPYPYTGNFFDCFGKNKTLAERIYLQAYPIIDITSMPDDEIKKHKNMAILDFAQKYSVLNRDIQDWIENIIEELGKGYLSSEQCQALLYYTFREADTFDVRKLLKRLKNIRVYGEDIMSVAQKLEQQGLQQGRREEDFVIAKKMLAKRFDPNLIKEITGLSDQELLSLED